MDRANHFAAPEAIINNDTDYVRLDLAYSDRIVRVHDEGAPSQHLETIEKSKHYVAVVDLLGAATVTIEDDEAVA